MIRAANVFQRRMVLQRDQAVPIWGTAPAGHEVSATFKGHEVHTTATADGTWRLHLPPLPADFAGGKLTIGDGRSEISFDDVLVGDVWLCSGQSNMDHALKEEREFETTIKTANHPPIRFLRVSQHIGRRERGAVLGSWVRCTPESAPAMSAVAYHFAEELRKHVDVPIGILQSAYPGTPTESWMSEEALRAHPQLKCIVDTWDRFVREYPASQEARDRVAAERERALRATGMTPPPWSSPPKGPDDDHRPANMFKGMIEPLLPFGIKGVLWYQGEANTWRSKQQQTLLPALVNHWRDLWQRSDLPFMYVQLPAFEADWLEPTVWAETREAQLKVAQQLPHSAMVVAVDQGDLNDLHPRTKKQIGRRLAFAAAATVYGIAMPYRGPVYSHMTTDGSSIRLHFEPVDGALQQHGDALAGFTIAGADRQFVSADARIDGHSAVVSSSAVSQPVAARYAWANGPAASLFDSHGLPASPFRTDDWPGLTDDRHEPVEY